MRWGYDPKTYACGCVRGVISCPAAGGIYRETSVAFQAAIVSGRWDSFEAARVRFEAHYRPNDSGPRK